LRQIAGRLKLFNNPFYFYFRFVFVKTHNVRTPLYRFIHCTGSDGTNNKWVAIIADDVHRGRKRFRTNDLFIPARPNYHHYDDDGGDDEDDDDDDDDDDDCACARARAHV
jgi:hypothetical protein